MSWTPTSWMHPSFQRICEQYWCTHAAHPQLPRQLGQQTVDYAGQSRPCLHLRWSLLRPQRILCRWGLSDSCHKLSDTSCQNPRREISYNSLFRLQQVGPTKLVKKGSQEIVLPALSLDLCVLRGACGREMDLLHSQANPLQHSDHPCPQWI